MGGWNRKWNKIENLEQELRDMVEVKKMKHREICKKFGVARQVVSKWCQRFSIKTERTGPRSGAGHPEWKGGIRLVGGYRYI